MIYMNYYNNIKASVKAFKEDVSIEMENYHLVNGFSKCDYPNEDLPHCGLCFRDL